MKWSKYQELMADPRISPLLIWHIGPGLGFNSHDDQKKWVEEKVRYATPRPWINLDEHEARGRRSGTLDIEWWVHYHINDDGQRSRRLQCTFDLDTTASVYDVFKAIKNWHATWWGKQEGDHHVVLDAVVMRRKVNLHNGTFRNESLDIYLPPDYDAHGHIASL